MSKSQNNNLETKNSSPKKTKFQEISGIETAELQERVRTFIQEVPIVADQVTQLRNSLLNGKKAKQCSDPENFVEFVIAEILGVTYEIVIEPEDSDEAPIQFYSADELAPLKALISQPIENSPEFQSLRSLLIEQAENQKESYPQDVQNHLCYVAGRLCLETAQTESEKAKAESFFRPSAEDGYLPSINGLGLYMEKEQQPYEAFELYQTAGEKGCFTAARNAARCYENKIGTDNNPNELLKFRLIAAKHGDRKDKEEFIILFFAKYDSDVLTRADDFLEAVKIVAEDAEFIERYGSKLVDFIESDQQEKRQRKTLGTETLFVALQEAYDGLKHYLPERSTEESKEDEEKKSESEEKSSESEIDAPQNLLSLIDVLRENIAERTKATQRFKLKYNLPKETTAEKRARRDQAALEAQSTATETKQEKKKEEEKDATSDSNTTTQESEEIDNPEFEKIKGRIEVFIRRVPEIAEQINQLRDLLFESEEARTYYPPERFPELVIAEILGLTCEGKSPNGESFYYADDSTPLALLIPDSVQSSPEFQALHSNLVDLAKNKKGDRFIENHLNYIAGRLCFEISSSPEEHAQAPSFFQRAANKKYPPAQNGLGLCFEHQVGVEQDFEVSSLFFEQAKAQRFIPAIYNLIRFYETGGDTKENRIQVFKHYRLAAEYGDEAAKEKFLTLFSAKCRSDNEEGIKSLSDNDFSVALKVTTENPKFLKQYGADLEAVVRDKVETIEPSSSLEKLHNLSQQISKYSQNKDVSAKLRKMVREPMQEKLGAFLKGKGLEASGPAYFQEFYTKKDWKEHDVKLEYFNQSDSFFAYAQGSVKQLPDYAIPSAKSGEVIIRIDSSQFPKIDLILNSRPATDISSSSNTKLINNNQQQQL